MSKYLTTAQYRAADEAIPALDSAPDSRVSTYITRAERAIDNFLQLDARIGGFEPHTVTWQEAFDVTTRKTSVPNFPIPFRSIKRYAIQIANSSSTTGAGYFVDIYKGDITVNQVGGYIEILPLQAITYTMVPVLGPFGMTPPVVQYEYTTGYYFPLYGEVLTTDDYLTYTASRGFWSDSATLDLALNLQPTSYTIPSQHTVYKNGVALAFNTGYMYNANEGTVTFPTVLLDTDVVTLDYAYQIPDDVKEATVLQTSYLLAVRELNAYGLAALDSISSDGQSISRPVYDPSLRGLCPAAADCLSKYTTQYPFA